MISIMFFSSVRNIAFLLATTSFAGYAQQQSLSELIAPVFTQLRANNKFMSSKSIIIDNISVDKKQEEVLVSMPKSFVYFPVRNNTYLELQDSIRHHLPDSISNYKVKILANGHELNFYIPNFYRNTKDIDKERIVKPYKGIPLLTPESKPSHPEKGLLGKHIAVWSSHGRYFEPTENRWQWQRPRLYGISEDTYTGSIVIPFLLPMLENAGAITLMPKERDIQPREVIVDNDNANSSNFIVKNAPKSVWSTDSGGFSNSKTKYYRHDNPFNTGTYKKIKSKKNGQASVEWIPSFPATGEYSVYISYKTIENSTQDTHYTVHHTGGSTSFSINQTMGGGTWIYLGKFKFKKGRNQKYGSVCLTNRSKDHGIVTADAVKFGGGIGNIARAISDTLPDSCATTSNFPRFLEAGRYWLQWAGFPDSVYNINYGKNEYKDDFMSRALWVNNLAGGSVRLPNKRGKNIPIDLAFALHSDAGISSKDNTIGSLAIHMTNNLSTYENGTPRIASRDLSDLIQTQTVDDINKIFKCNWSRRNLADESYYEARVPEVPTLLFEFLSHQNFQDMKFGLDPHFKFTVARAIYKGLLKYLYAGNENGYVVQPLPIRDFSAEFYNEKKDIVFLSWKGQKDPLEPTADPTHYIVYKAIDNNGFDNGMLVSSNHALIRISPDTIYHFKITAINDGGESFPSEILSVAKSSKERGTTLIVNGFERVDGPMSFNNGQYQGFMYNVDAGVPYKYDISFTGCQYDFNKKSECISNDKPGIGASFGNYEDMVIAGNTFKYPAIHGASLLANGYSFASCSVGAFAYRNINTNPYSFIDFIYGNQKETTIGDTTTYSVFTPEVIEMLDKYINHHGCLLISGSYIASDVFAKDECDSMAINFIENKLHFSWGNESALASGMITSRPNADLLFGSHYNYFYEPNRYRYYSSMPDVLAPANGGEIALRYANSTQVAGVMYNGKDYKTVVSAIPFEIIKSKKQRNDFMRTVISFFELQKKNNHVKMVTVPAKATVNSKSYISTKKSYKQNFSTK